MVDAALQSVIERTLGRSIVRTARVHGGDVAVAFAVDLDDGRRVFAKTHPAAPPQFFTTEATGLEWLRAANAVAIPEVLAVSDAAPNHLVLEWIDEGGRLDRTERDLGVALAGLHRAGAPSFGREDRRSTGSRGLPNEPRATWAEFYAVNRLLPLAKLARDGHALSEPTIAALEVLAGRLSEFGGTDEPPARLHGDLWAGNRVVDGDGRSWLIDPAAHGGHREFDLAMMRLFGGFSDECFAAYAEVFPLAGRMGGTRPAAPDRTPRRPRDQVRGRLRRRRDASDRAVPLNDHEPSRHVHARPPSRGRNGCSATT
jgi:fructosamine-3-kinase